MQNDVINAFCEITMETYQRIERPDDSQGEVH